MDEENCPEYCSIAAFSSETKQVTCSDEKRYTESEACSGVVEACEQSCPKCHPKLTFTCPAVGGSQKRCIRRSKVCDGINDCDDGADEKNCTPMIECGIEYASQFTCDRKCLDVLKTPAVVVTVSGIAETRLTSKIANSVLLDRFDVLPIKSVFQLILAAMESLNAQVVVMSEKVSSKVIIRLQSDNKYRNFRIHRCPFQYIHVQ